VSPEPSPRLRGEGARSADEGRVDIAIEAAPPAVAGDRDRKRVGLPRRAEIAGHILRSARVDLPGAQMFVQYLRN
jgi:hypothetical protein